MTDTARVARTYVIAIALLASVLIWTAVSAAPLPGQVPTAAQAQPAADPRVATLAQRRAELIALQRLLSETQLRALARIAAGRAVHSLDELRHPFSVEAWDEQPTMTPAEVPEALDRLWETIAEESFE